MKIYTYFLEGDISIDDDGIFFLGPNYPTDDSRKIFPQNLGNEPVKFHNETEYCVVGVVKHNNDGKYDEEPSVIIRPGETKIKSAYKNFFNNYDFSEGIIIRTEYTLIPVVE